MTLINFNIIKNLSNLSLCKNLSLPHLDNLKNIRLFLNNFLKDHQIENRTAKEIELAVDEAASNIIKHGYNRENKNNKIEIKLEL